MNDDSTPAQNSPHSFRVGRRLAMIREELGRQYGESNWSQAAVARNTGLTQNIVWRIEQGEGGKIESWLKVMSLYETKGYNLNWILTEQNALVSKFHFDDATWNATSHLREELLKKLDQYQAVVGVEMSLLRELLVDHIRN